MCRIPPHIEGIIESSKNQEMQKSLRLWGNKIVSIYPPTEN